MTFYEVRENSDLYSLKYGDIYWSKDGAWEEKNYIFLNSIEIREKWKSSNSFQILELGFGAGINFLATLNAWRETPNKTGNLQYFSIEENPLPKSTLIEIYKNLKISSELYDEFLNSYFFIDNGIHFLSLHNSTFHLYLYIGNAYPILKEISTEFDVLFLDGFSPSKNPDMWSKNIFTELFRICKLNGLFTTYSTSTIVKDNAKIVGFEIQKIKGFGKKKWMLQGTKKSNTIKEVNPHPYYSFNHLKRSKINQVTIIGGGLGGTSIARALAKRNFSVTIIERENRIASGSSGNPAGIINPNITAEKTAISQIEVNAYFHIQRLISEYSSYNDFSYKRTGLIYLVNENEYERKIRGINNHSLSHLFDFKKEKISNLNHIFLNSSAWINPISLCDTNINFDNLNKKIDIILNTHALNFQRKNEHWIINDNYGNIYESEVLIISNSIDSNQFQLTNWIPIRMFRGQIIYLHKDYFSFLPEHIFILDDIYIIPQENSFILGATYEKDNMNLSLDFNSTIYLLEKFKNYFNLNYFLQPESIQGRVGIRATTPDHLPILGPVPDINFFEKEYNNLTKGGRGLGLKDAKYLDGLYLFTGFGSKGILLTNYLSEILANLICGNHIGISDSLFYNLIPNRFIIRHLMKKKGY